MPGADMPSSLLTRTLGLPTIAFGRTQVHVVRYLITLTYTCNEAKCSPTVSVKSGALSQARIDTGSRCRLAVSRLNTSD